MPDPRGGHKGRLALAPAAGQALVVITGVQDANYERGQTSADAHGMDAAHGFKVITKSSPQITASQIFDWAQTTVMKAVQEAEAGRGVPFAWYPIGEFSDGDALSHGVAGTAFALVNTGQSLTDPIKNDLTLVPALPDWNPFGDFDPA
jgi:hypothetical protein